MQSHSFANYDFKAANQSIHQVRCTIFHSMKKTIENLPPTKDALVLHVKRSHYHCLVWKRALETHPHLPSVLDSGWRLVEASTGSALLEPQLLTTRPSSAVCLELASCGCSVSPTFCSTRRCKCTRLGLACTRACRCKDNCRNPRSVEQEEDCSRLTH